MSGAEVIYYDKELKYLHHLFKTLPESIPVGDVHNFFAYFVSTAESGEGGRHRLCRDCCQSLVNGVIVDPWDSRKAGKKKIWDGQAENSNYKQDPNSQDNSLKSAEWYPYPSKTMLLLDICDNLPRLPASESLMRTIIWVLKQCGASDVPSLDALRKTQKSLRSSCGVPTISCTSIQGKNFCINDPRAIIRMECANPEIGSQLHLYPEVNTEGSVSEIWHGAKLCKELSPDLLSPTFDVGHGTHYVNEIAQLIDGHFVIPVRWIKVDGAMHADVYSVELNIEKKADVQTDIVRVSAALLAFNFRDLDYKNQIPEWSDAATASGYKDHMPNPHCSVAKGDPLYTIFIDYFLDDVSGNRSKSWNKHWNTYMTNQSLPRQLLQNEFYVHFVSASQHASIPEQFKEFQKLINSTGCSCYQLIVNADPSDNPMQAEICSCMGQRPIFHAENAGQAVVKRIKLQTKGIMQCFHLESIVPRASFSKQSRGKSNWLVKVMRLNSKRHTYTASGIKDKYTEYWINDILSQFKKEVERGASKDAVSMALKQWVKDNNDNIYSPFLTTDGFDAPHDTPIELLHTILLGVLKYVWHTTHKSWTVDQKKMFELRLQAADTSGLAVEGIRAVYIVQYANSLIGSWKTVGEISALLWYSEIDDMESYCLAAQEGVKHRVTGGAWPLKGEGNEIIWTHCGPAACQLMQDQPMLQRLFGWKKAEILPAGA
ncbi:hypothetical protein DFH08DRAFT_826815 [Mycena albidolilacea]|uniref:Uncharacterized protein n=1 Tax=Mycena albidolilacea TaxID=1033008 RepID=A0AAD6YZQ2_9AGAR|nr:hypothetical protein DFH08DRAFT_826815 [Mycena albidolilacea]